MRRSLLALALGFVLSACWQGGEPTTGPSATAPASTEPSSGTSGTGPSVSGPPFNARCTLVLGFSVTRQWYEEGGFETQPGVNDARWELIFEGGGDVSVWANPEAQPYHRTPISPCEAQPDRALFQVAALRWRNHSSEEMASELQTATANIRATWPSVEVIELIPIVGGPGGQPCEATSQPGRTVDASLMNPVMNGLIADVANGDDVRAGPDLQLADCSQYMDGIGHITPEGSRHVAAVIAEHYGT